MRVEVHGNETHIFLSDATGARAKALFSIEALVYAIGAVAMLIAAIAGFSSDVFPVSLFSFGGAVILGIAFWRYINRVICHEKLVVQPGVLILTKLRVSNISAVGYPFNEIEHLHYIGFEKPVDHPMKSETFDALGLQTQLEVVNSVMAEGNIGFRHQGRLVRFGVGVPSWEAEELAEKLEELSFGLLVLEGLPEDIPNEEWNACDMNV